jgi:dienelactone hydrolase
MMHRAIFFLRAAVFACLLPSALCQAETGDTAAAPPSVDGLKRQLAAALRQPMDDGMDVSGALTSWFAAEKADTAEAKAAHYREGLAALTDLKPLPQATWPENPSNIELKLLGPLNIRNADDVACNVVEFTVDKLRQYALLFRPLSPGEFPLIVYLHGAAFGVPEYSIGWLVRLARQGYVVVAPALRGEDLLATRSRVLQEFKCEGEIENLKGEVNDVLAVADGALRLPYVRDGKYGIVGHSFGAGAGLLAAARSDKVATVVSYDAWLTNPFHFYWRRLSGGSFYYWESWEAYCEQPIADQLAGLMTRSIVHHADLVTAPMLIFIGERDGAGYHSSHQALAAALKKHGKPYRYVEVPDGAHNFVLYEDREPAKVAAKIQTEWLSKHFPPVPPKPAANEGAPEKDAPTPER